MWLPSFRPHGLYARLPCAVRSACLPSLYGPWALTMPGAVSSYCCGSLLSVAHFET